MSSHGSTTKTFAPKSDKAPSKALQLLVQRLLKAEASDTCWFSKNDPMGLQNEAFGIYIKFSASLWTCFVTPADKSNRCSGEAGGGRRIGKSWRRRMGLGDLVHKPQP